MSFRVFFAFSNGLAQTIQVPKGTLASIMAHVRYVETTLGVRAEEPMHADDMPHWNRYSKAWRSGFAEVEDETLCKTVEAHNQWVRDIFDQIAGWADKPVEDGEEITPKHARAFWHALEQLKVDPQRWTREYFVARMGELYEAMRGREAAGMAFDAKPLTERQAAAVFNLFDQYIDRHDMRLDVPKGRDYLASSYDGGYDWCEKCGAVAPEDGDACTKRKCPIRAERP